MDKSINNRDDKLIEVIAYALHHCDQQDGAYPCVFGNLDKHNKRRYFSNAEAVYDEIILHMKQRREDADALAYHNVFNNKSTPATGIQGLINDGEPE